MGASEQTAGEAESEPKEDDKDLRPEGQNPDGGQEVPLFLRGRSDGWKGNAQDEKDEAGE